MGKDLTNSNVDRKKNLYKQYTMDLAQERIILSHKDNDVSEMNFTDIKMLQLGIFYFRDSLSLSMLVLMIAGSIKKRSYNGKVS